MQFEAPPSQLECILPRMIMASSLFSDVAFLYRGKKGSREEVPLSSLDGEGKVLGLYFSAHWCPPCRAFTPKLAEWYTRLTTGPLKEKLEIVFLSSDRNEDSFDSYFDEMPWLAMPFHEREHKVFSTACKSLSTACSQLQYTYSYSCSTSYSHVYATPIFTQQYNYCYNSQQSVGCGQYPNIMNSCECTEACMHAWLTNPH